MASSSVKLFSCILSLCKFLSFTMPCGKGLHVLIILFAGFELLPSLFIWCPCVFFIGRKRENSDSFYMAYVACNFTDSYCFPLSSYSCTRSLVDINNRFPGIYDEKEIRSQVIICCLNTVWLPQKKKRKISI